MLKFANLTVINDWTSPLTSFLIFASEIYFTQSFHTNITFIKCLSLSLSLSLSFSVVELYIFTTSIYLNFAQVPSKGSYNGFEFAFLSTLQLWWFNELELIKFFDSLANLRWSKWLLERNYLRRMNVRVCAIAKKMFSPQIAPSSKSCEIYILLRRWHERTYWVVLMRKNMETILFTMQSGHSNGRTILQVQSVKYTLVRTHSNCNLNSWVLKEVYFVFFAAFTEIFPLSFSKNKLKFSCRVNSIGRIC